MLETLTKIFGTKHERDIKKIRPIVEEINHICDTYADLSQDELKGKTAEFRDRLQEATREARQGLAELQAELDGEADVAARQDLLDEIDEVESEIKEIEAEVLDEILPEDAAGLARDAGVVVYCIVKSC